MHDNNKYITNTKTYFENADKYMNGFICRILLFLPIVFPLMFLGNKLDIFAISYPALIFVSVLGTILCTMPIILLRLKVSHKFLKYYIVLSIGFLVCILATNESIGIWITYSLILLLTCLYYDKKLTACAIVVGYIYMLIALYLRAPGEVAHLSGEQSPLKWFIAYGLGLTLEYSVVSFIVMSIVINSTNNLIRQQRLQVQLEEEQERYEIALSSSSDIIFEYDIADSVMQIYGEASKGMEQRKKEDYITKIRLGEIVADEDEDKFTYFLSGHTENPIEIRIIAGTGKNKFSWYSAGGKTIMSNGKPVRIIGKMRDISVEKQKQLELLDSLERDKLTKLYTKDAAEKYISEYLEKKFNDEICVLLIINIGNLQHINEAYGYMFGDLILSEAAHIIKMSVKNHDITARLNGVEFMVFITDATEAGVNNIIDGIYEKINNIHIIDDKNVSLRITTGMATTDESGNNFTELFRNADATLSYMVDNNIEYVLSYKEIQKQLGGKLEEKHLTKRSTFDIINNTELSSSENMLMFIFSVLEHSKNLKSTINILLAHIGHEFGLKKISVVDTDLNFMTNNISYQWCADGKDYDIRRNYPVKKSDLQIMLQNYGNTGIFELTPEIYASMSDEARARLSDPTKRTCLCVEIYELGSFKGTFSFEHEKENFEWTSEIKDTLKELSKVLSTHINKINADSTSRAKSNFLSNMSHEIRTPMNAIIGMTNIAKNSIGNNDKVQDCLNKITSSANYLLSLINDILDMSRIESGKMSIINEPFILSELISSIDILIRTQAEDKNIKFELINDIKHDFIIGDNLRLKQVLVNITGNALKFTPTDGTGSITMRVEETASGNDSATVRFSVKDNGIGISKENQAKIFQSFEQAENNTVKKFGGTGLGLAISSNLVHMMGGILEVESSPGNGSEFFFTVSFAVAPNMSKEIEAPKNNSKNNVTFAGKRALLVEDDDINTEIAVNALESLGLIVETASNGQEAVDAFIFKKSGYYDVIFMDIRMPVMDGLEATRLIRISDKEYARSVPIIAMTANAFDEDEKKSIESGMDCHITKPIDFSLLKNILNQIF